MAAMDRVVYPGFILLLLLYFSPVYGWKDLPLTHKLLTKGPFFQGTNVAFEARVIPNFSSLKEAENVQIKWNFPAIIAYKSHAMLPDSKNPLQVTSSANQLLMKFSTLSSSERVHIIVNATIDPGKTIRDVRFHYESIGTAIKYSWLGVYKSDVNHDGNIHFPFFSPGCSSFGSLAIKDSEIMVSTLKTYHSSNKTWVTMTSFNLLGGVIKMKLNFIQIDLKSSIGINMAVIQGVPKYDPIPKDIIKLTFSNDLLKWKMYSGRQNVEIIQGDDSNDVTIAVWLKKPIKSRYLRINLPPYGNAAIHSTAFTMSLHSCNVNSVLGNQGSIVPVGVESPSIVPDSKITAASSAGLEYKASLARLNIHTDGGGWCASTCDPAHYLQVDLTDEWMIAEVETQSQHWTSGNINVVKTYSLSYSLGGSTWTPYKINGGTKIFWGNDVANIGTKHKLLISFTAKFVRFEPRTCINSPCMRVELHGTKVHDLGKTEVPPLLDRSFLLKQSTNNPYICVTEVMKGKPTCYYTKDNGVSWKAIPKKVLTVIAYDPIKELLYGLSKNGKNYMRSRDSDGKKWRGISKKAWNKVKVMASLITAIHVPFVPISRTDYPVIDPIVQMTSFNGDKWLVDQVGVYHRPSNGSTQQVISFLPYITDLSSNVCHTGVCVHGRCEASGPNFKCYCSMGYVGEFCDTPTDECSSSPCQNGGICNDEFLKYTCSCASGFFGKHCEYDDKCASNPCMNGATCTRGNNMYTCTCPVPYSGTRCEVFDYCSSAPCLQGGTCSNQASSFLCACPNGYSGTKCEVAPCDNNPCLSGGTCTLAPAQASGYTCTCAPNYGGPTCSVTPCSNNPCLNGGTCTLAPAQASGYTCTCVSNYGGPTCSVSEYCVSTPCLNGGTCTSGASSFSCACPNLFSGTRCQVTPCSSIPCLNGGTCNLVSSLSAGYNCTCTSTYVGLRCGYGPGVFNRGCTYTSNTWSYPSGKYDKLVFYSNMNLDLHAICISETSLAKESSKCTLTIRIRKEGITGTYLGTNSGIWHCGQNPPNRVTCPPFNAPVRLNANERYILELTMSVDNGQLRKLNNQYGNVGGPFRSTLPDNSQSVSYYFETVSSAELADSTGTTVSGGGIYGIVAQYAK